MSSELVLLAQGLRVAVRWRAGGSMSTSEQKGTCLVTAAWWGSRRAEGVAGGSKASDRGRREK